MQNNQKATLREKTKLGKKIEGLYLGAAKYIVKHFILLPVLGTEVQGDFHKPGSCTCAALKNTLRGCLSPSSTAGWPVKHLAWWQRHPWVSPKGPSRHHGPRYLCYTLQKTPKLMGSPSQHYWLHHSHPQYAETGNLFCPRCGDTLGVT